MSRTTHSISELPKWLRKEAMYLERGHAVRCGVKLGKVLLSRHGKMCAVHLMRLCIKPRPSLVVDTSFRPAHVLATVYMLGHSIGQLLLELNLCPLDVSGMHRDETVKTSAKKSSNTRGVGDPR